MNRLVSVPALATALVLTGLVVGAPSSAVPAERPDARVPTEITARHVPSPVVYGKPSAVVVTLPAAATGTVTLETPISVRGRATVVDGTATFAMPRRGAGGVYDVVYSGDDAYDPARTIVRVYVIDANTTIRLLKAPRTVRRGHRAKVRFFVDSADIRPSSGNVRMFAKNTRPRGWGGSTPRQGRATVTTRPFRQLGKVRFVAQYVASRGYQSSETRRFVIRVVRP